jgi:hypothetical protein
MTGPIGAVIRRSGRSDRRAFGRPFFPVLDPCGEEAVLEVEGDRRAYGPVSFELRRGGVLALVGLRGGGHD